MLKYIIMHNISSSLIITITFITIIPVPSRLIPEWTPASLRYFPLMLPATGLIFSLLWLMSLHVLSLIPAMSPALRGFMMTLLTLALTGGLHLDGLMDTCDAVFSHRDRDTRLRILADTHAGSFAVMGCVAVLMAKTLLFAELLTLSADPVTLSVIPVFSRLGMGLLITNLPFAKPGGLAVMLGSSRKRRDNLAFMMMFIALIFAGGLAVTMAFTLWLAVHVVICLQLFGGITGDLLGAFVEASELIMLLGTVIVSCT